MPTSGTTPQHLLKFKLQGLSNEGRAELVSGALEALPHVQQVDMNIAKELVRLLTDVPLTEAAIAEVVKPYGVTMSLVESSMLLPPTQAVTPEAHPSTPRVLNLKIEGMHCASCEVLIERKFKKIPGIENVQVSYVSGKAKLYCSGEPRLSDLQAAIKADGYNVSPWSDQSNIARQSSGRNTKKDYLQIGVIFLIIVALYLILKQFDLVPNLGISDNMSYGFVFLIGLVAATSTCLAVTGGLLLAVAGKYNEKFPNLTGVQKFKPTIYFNIGRVVSYTVLGGAVGALGSVLIVSPRATGYLSIAASLAMIIIGFQLLKLFPWMRRFQPKMPKFLAHKIHDMSGKDSKSGPFLLGAATFFLPCGFTQALQLYILSTGDMTTGALTMLAFSLGTMPALMSLSAISSFAKGAFQRYFLKFSGVLVIMFGVFNVNNGLALTGSNFSLAAVFASSGDVTTTGTAVKVVDGKQIVDMQVIGLNYSPHQFTVVQGVPVEWRIDGSRAQGCAQVVIIPKLDITKYLSPSSPTVISFTPQETGSITFSCPMGMTTGGSAFNVVSNTTGIVAAKTEEQPTADTPPCDPEAGNCQRVSIEISRDLGFYPRSLTVKKGIPVEFIVDDQIDLGGCMGTMTIPEYGVAQLLKIGKNVIRFTPTRTGTVNAVCSMGVLQTSFNVID